MTPTERLDAFAMAALTGMLARPNSSPFGHTKDREGYVAAAYEFAEAMEKERERVQARADERKRKEREDLQMRYGSALTGPTVFLW